MTKRCIECGVYTNPTPSEVLCPRCEERLATTNEIVADLQDDLGSLLDVFLNVEDDGSYSILVTDPVE